MRSLVRLGAVAVDADRVLLHRAEFDDFWSLPGGRLKFGENLVSCIEREMQEEIGAKVEVGRLLWVIENFFVHPSLEEVPRLGAPPERHHEIGLYHRVTLPSRFVQVGSFWGEERDHSEPYRLEFRWFHQSELAGSDIRPGVLRGLLAGNLPDIPEMVTAIDTDF